jgi:hypothetical protein
MKSQPHPNICVTLYDKEFGVTWECPEGGCKLGLYSMMPPEQDMRCTYERHSACNHPFAQKEAMRSALARVKKMLREQEED